LDVPEVRLAAGIGVQVVDAHDGSLPARRGGEAGCYHSPVTRSSIGRGARGLTLVLLSLLTTSCAALRLDPNWWSARRHPSGQAPGAATTREAVIQVYAARTVGWKGLLGVHTWIAVKRSGADEYTRYEVMGWGVRNGAPAIRVNRTGPDNYWFGSKPDLLVDL